MLKMNKKDQHVEVICMKFDLYKSEMDKEFSGYDYPYSNLTPWTNYFVKGEQIAQEDLDFEKWFDEEWIFEKSLYERIKIKMNTKRYFGCTLLEWTTPILVIFLYFLIAYPFVLFLIFIYG